MQFSSKLQQEWTFPPYRERQQPFVIDHCKSLNLIDETVWTSPYGDYPLLRVAGGSVRSWRWDDRGHVDNYAAVLLEDDKPKAVAAVAEGWSRHPGRIVIGSLDEDQVTSTALRSLRFPDGRAFPDHPHIVGRGSELHVIDGLDWYRSTFEDLVG